MHVGRVVGGKYRIESKLGEGGFGAVFLARQIGLDRPVALKLCHVDALLRDETRGRFRREAQLAQALTHPNIVRMFDYGETEEGIPFIAWEMLEGRGLESVLRTDGAMSVAEVVEIGTQTVKALMEAHAMGIVHRDIKPANLFLCDFAGAHHYVKVLDFGIAAVGTELKSQTLTRERTTVGTPAYMAPEQVLGQPLDGRADLYSLGLTLAECLAGRPVFEGGSAMRIAIAQASPEPAPIPSYVLGSPLGPVIARATQKNRDARYASAEQMLRALERVTTTSTSEPPSPAAATEPSTSMPAIVAGTPRQHLAATPSRSRSWIVGLAVALVVATVGGGVALVAWLRRSQPLTRREEPAICSNPVGAGACGFNDANRRQLAALLAPRGFPPKRVVTKDSFVAVFEAQKGAILTLVMGATGLGADVPGKGQSNTVVCWHGCSLRVFAAGGSASSAELESMVKTASSALERD